MLAGFFALFTGDSIWPPSTSQIGGVIGGLLAFLGGIYVVVTDEDTTDALDNARRAIDWSENQELAYHEILELSYEYEDALDQMASLYTVMTVARGTIERAVQQSHIDEVSVISTCLEATKWNLRIALEFRLNEIWTVCVYKAEKDEVSGEKQLRLVAHNRSVDCDIENARPWKPGIGVGGVAFAKNDEVVVPNLDDPAVGTAFRLEKAMKKEEDIERYKSLFAVPVQVGDREEAWGVVMATSSVPHHFGNNENVGVDPEEAVRALAGIVALAVAVCKNNHQIGGKQRTENG